MWIRHLDFCFNFTTWDELMHLAIHQQHLKKLCMIYVVHEWVMAGEQPAVANVNHME